jgi:hypothetical protein
MAVMYSYVPEDNQILATHVELYKYGRFEMVGSVIFILRYAV